MLPKSENFLTSSSILRDGLEELYKSYNRRKYIHPDPLEFLYDYPELPDRELVALIASSLSLIHI